MPPKRKSGRLRGRDVDSPGTPRNSRDSRGEDSDPELATSEATRLCNQLLAKRKAQARECKYLTRVIDKLIVEKSDLEKVLETK